MIDPIFLILKTRFQVHRPFGSEEEMFERLYRIRQWRPYWTCDPETLNKRLSTRPMDGSHVILLYFAKRFLKGV